MTSLTGRKPQNTYKDLLQVSNSNSGIDATCRPVEDGEGTQSPLKLATNKVCIDTGTFQIGSGVTVIIPGITNTSGTTVFTNSGTTFYAATGFTYNFCGSGTSIVLGDTTFCSGATIDFTNATVTGLTVTNGTFTTLTATTLIGSSATFTNLTVTGTVNFCSATTTLGDTVFCSGSSIDFTNATVSGLTCEQDIGTEGANFTLALADAGTTRICTTALTCTIPLNATVAFNTGATINLVREGGLVTISPVSGVTLRSVSGNTTIAPQYAGAQLFKRGTNTWYLIGQIA